MAGAGKVALVAGATHGAGHGIAAQSGGGRSRRPIPRIPLCLLVGLTLWIDCGPDTLAAQTREDIIHEPKQTREEMVRQSNDRLIPQAESGSLFAIGQLARNYSYLGYFEEAARWSRRGAELDVPDMQVQYAHLLVEGKGVARNEKEALALYESASRRGAYTYLQAYLPLARLYARGAGTTRDLVEAFALAELTVANYERTSESWVVDDARSLQSSIQAELTAEEIKLAKQRAREYLKRGRNPRNP